MTSLYDKRIAALGYPDIKCTTTRFRESTEHLTPGIKSMQMNRGWPLVSDDVLNKAIVDMKDNTSIDVAIILNRREYLPTKQAFTGSFSTSCEAESIPPMLRAFLHMLLD